MDNTWNPSDDALLAMVRSAIEHDPLISDQGIENLIYNESLATASQERIGEIRHRVNDGEYPSW